MVLKLMSLLWLLIAEESCWSCDAFTCNEGEVEDYDGSDDDDGWIVSCGNSSCVDGDVAGRDDEDDDEQVEIICFGDGDDNARWIW